MSKKKLSLIALILMIFSSVYGFANMPRSFYLMGYAAIPWYFFTALLFFIPYAFMISEYGAAFRKEKGGILSWMDKSVGGRFAFIGTFMWYASYAVWMVSVSSSLWLVLSYAFYGQDQTASWSLFGLNSVQTLGVLGIFLVLFVTAVGSRGLGNISKVAAVGGVATAFLNVVLLAGGLIVYLKNGHLAQPIENITQSFTVSPMAEYQSTLGMLAFLTFAIFSFGGLEAIGSLADETENPEKNFPKGILIAAAVVALGYALGILACGAFTNWGELLSHDKVHMGNVAYVVLNNLGYQLGLSFGADQATAVILGNWMARYVGASMFIALVSAFFILSYSPLRTLIQGSPKGIWPEKLCRINKNDMPANAMWAQALLVVVIIGFVSFGGQNASQFFRVLILMTNVAMSIPYMFLAIAFIFFKKKQLAGEFGQSFMVFKTQRSATIFAIVVTVIVGFANFFAIIEPTVQDSNGGLFQSIAMICGPVFFAIVGYMVYSRHQKRQGKH